MKITKGRLKEIIKEELAAENAPSGMMNVGSSGLPDMFPKLDPPATPDTRGHDHFTTLKTIYGAVAADEELEELPRIFLTHISAAARVLADYLGSQE